MPPLTEREKGILGGVASYSLWGLFPLYFHSLAPAGALEVLGHRIVWTFVFLIGVLAVQRRWAWVAELRADRARLARTVAAGLLLSTNWVLYVWAVNADRVLDASLGYFINPLVTVALGVVLLREQVRPLQVAALAFGAASVMVLIVGYGEVPWVALVLALSFGGSGYLKKQVDLATVPALAAETAFLFPIALVGLGAAALAGKTAIGHHGVLLDAKLLGLGVVTAVPLLLFGVATRRIPLVLVGLLQYLTPTLQFLIGWLYYGEKVPPGRLAGFALTWVALFLLAADGVRASSRSDVAPA